MLAHRFYFVVFFLMQLTLHDIYEAHFCMTWSDGVQKRYRQQNCMNVLMMDIESNTLYLPYLKCDMCQERSSCSLVTFARLKKTHLHCKTTNMATSMRVLCGCDLVTHSNSLYSCLLFAIAFKFLVFVQFCRHF